MRGNAIAAIAGVLFAVGLTLSGMTQPQKVIGFLDFTGAWDPSLMMVMVGGLLVFGIALRLVQRRGKPWVGTHLEAPSSKVINGRLLVGAALFGVGWGLGGFCPGPGIVSVGSLSWGALAFVGSMAVGQVLFEQYHRRAMRARVATLSAEAPAPEQLPVCG